MATKSIRLSDGTDTLLPESAKLGVDSNNHIYHKFADGTVIVRGTATYTIANSDWTAWEGIYYCKLADIDLTYIEDYTGKSYFLATPYVNMMRVGGNSILNIECNPSNHGIHDIYIYRPTATSGTITLDFVAIGHWK